MSLEIYAYGLLIGQIFLILAMLCAFIRFILGPHAQDRIICFDILYMLTMLLFMSYALKYQSEFYLDIALFIALIGFVSSIALAKFIMRGEIIE